MENIKVFEEPKGKFIVEEVFHVIGMGFILADHIFKGEIAVGDVLKLSDGKFLGIRNIEKGNKKVERAIVNEAVGVLIDGVGWSPNRKNLEKLKVINVIERLRKEAMKRYSHMPKELVKKLVEKEVKTQLEKELDKIALEIYIGK